MKFCIEKFYCKFFICSFCSINHFVYLLKILKLLSILETHTRKQMCRNIKLIKDIFLWLLILLNIILSQLGASSKIAKKLFNEKRFNFFRDAICVHIFLYILMLLTKRKRTIFISILNFFYFFSFQFKYYEFKLNTI